MTTGRLSVDKDKTSNGMRIHSVLQLLLRQTRLIETPLTPSTAKEAKAAKARKAKVMAKVSSATEKEIH